MLLNASRGVGLRRQNVWSSNVTGPSGIAWLIFAKNALLSVAGCIVPGKLDYMNNKVHRLVKLTLETGEERKSLQRIETSR